MKTIMAFRSSHIKKGDVYTVSRDKVKLYSRYGFWASKNFDISETIIFSDFVINMNYAIVDIDVVDVNGGRMNIVGDKVRILKVLKGLKNLIKYDKTGEWCYRYAKEKGENLTRYENELLTNHLISLDCEVSLYWCTEYAKNIRYANIYQLQKNIILKDKTGDHIPSFAAFVPKADVKLLQDMIIRKDGDGFNCYVFADYCLKEKKDIDIKLLQEAVIRKDTTGKNCLYFASNITGADIDLLQQVVIEKDKTGEYCYLFAKDVKNADIKKLQDAVIKKDETGSFCYTFARDVSGADIKLLQHAVIEKGIKRGDNHYIYLFNHIRGADEKLTLEYAEKYDRWTYEYWDFIKDMEKINRGDVDDHN